MRWLLTGVMAVAVSGAPLVATAQRGPNIQLTAMEGRAKSVSPHVEILPAWPNAGLVVGDKGVLVVDTGLGPENGAVMLREAIKRATKGQKLYLVTTHAHPEHAGGQGAFPASTTVIRARVQQEDLLRDGQNTAAAFARRNAEFARLLAAPIDTRADVVFDGEYRLDLGGGVVVRLINLPGGHTEGDTVALVEPDGVLFAGDLVESMQSPNFSCAACSPKRWLAALDRIEALKPRIIVPTHGPAPVDPSHIGRSRTFLSEVTARARALKAEGKTAAEAGPIVQAEMTARYPGWTGLQNLGATVARIYAEP